VPRLLREKFGNDITIGYFHHIPFPFFEIFRLLPNTWRSGILEGLLGADLVGFHTYPYSQYFAGCVHRILGYEHNLSVIAADTRSVVIDTFPMGIDYEKFQAAANQSAVKKQVAIITKTVGNLKLILSIDRLDYTKGIGQRLEAYDLFLDSNPDWRNKVVLALVVVPSRTNVGRYQEMKEEIDQLVGKINGKYGTVNWTPIMYQYKSLSFAELVALYATSQVALVTPMRDGMNLIAKEYLATRSDRSGVLVLSETAGAVQELGEALIINPHHVGAIAKAIKKALATSKADQKKGNAIMKKRLQRYTSVRWAEDFIQELQAAKKNQEGEQESKALTVLTKNNLVKKFARARRRLLLLDYDGTLVPFSKYPPQAKPNAKLLTLLSRLGRIPRTSLVIISGRDRRTLDKWFHNIPLLLVAEHGIWTKEKKKAWTMPKEFDNEWKKTVLPILENYVDRVPGSFVEKKEYSLAWHYRAATPGLSQQRAQELSMTLINLTANMDLQVVPGDKVIETRNAGANKGAAALQFLRNQKFDFVLALGDDTTDEDLFEALPKRAYSIKIGRGQSAAQYFLPDYHAALALLEDLKYKK